MTVLEASIPSVSRASEYNRDDQPVPAMIPWPDTREDAAYILDTFPIVKRKGEAKWGNYSTEDTILEIYAALAESQRTGWPYQTRLNPSPADPRCCHPPQS